MSLPPLDASRLPAVSGTARQLVVFVHGYGADGSDLISLGQHWQRLLPDAAFVSPNAPTRVPGAPSGFQWFPISRIDPYEMRKGVEVAEPVLEEFLNSELTRLGLRPEKLVLVGFSQGTMLSLHVGLRRSVPPAAIVGFSGMLAGPAPVLPGGAYPPVFLVHGDMDQVIPAQALFLAVGALEQAGVAVQWHLARGLGHGINPEGVALGGQFLKTAFANSL